MPLGQGGKQFRVVASNEIRVNVFDEGGDLVFDFARAPYHLPAG